MQDIEKDKMDYFRQNNATKFNRLAGKLRIDLFLLLLLFSCLTSAESRYQASDTFQDCSICPVMVVVPAGSFMMGAPADEAGRDKNEGPQHKVTIAKPFAVGKYEVTVREYAAFIDETGGLGSSEWRNTFFKQSDAHPVVNVSWKDATGFAHWLSVKTGHQYRLLSEAEWEYAARAGTTTAYTFGPTISKNMANFNNQDGGTVVVGSYPANAFGLQDVHGNVWEWVEDCWHDDYDGASMDGSAWVSHCSFDSDVRVLRGGSWFDIIPRDLRSAHRIWNDASDRGSDYGFRVARTL
ncbi:MAG: formylglycine-generating enzyme family protein [Chromatiales bacterium]|nr:formylglycine-generating enzyme family protein [Chromatiales bacterium]